MRSQHLLLSGPKSRSAGAAVPDWAVEQAAQQLPDGTPHSEVLAAAREILDIPDDDYAHVDPVPGAPASRVADADHTVPLPVVAELLAALRDATDHERAADLGKARAAADSRLDGYRERKEAAADQAGWVHSIAKAVAAATYTSEETRVRCAVEMLTDRIAEERAELAELKAAAERAADDGS